VFVAMDGDNKRSAPAERFEKKPSLTMQHIRTTIFSINPKKTAQDDTKKQFFRWKVHF